MDLIASILNTKELIERPPVLIDIGASGEIHRKWKKIAAWSVCLAFDADDREFNISESSGSGFRKLIKMNRIITSAAVDKADFYLTASPYCSSLLMPERESLSPWLLKDLFLVKEKKKLPAIQLSHALKEANIDYIDWLKTDTQGTDLRIFTSLPAKLSQGILAAEFEPGIIDAYQEEDKLFSVMEVMHKENFWLSSMETKGFQRFPDEFISRYSLKDVSRLQRASPCWAELCYLRNMARTRRDNLLLLVFALLEKQYGFALEICKSENDEIFANAEKRIIKILDRKRISIPLIILKRQFKKILARIND